MTVILVHYNAWVGMCGDSVGGMGLEVITSGVLEQNIRKMVLY